jgi:hypothetical protein
MNRVLLLASLVGCHTWNHSPGYDTRTSMVKHQLQVQRWQSCLPGACDKDGPAGPVRFSKVKFFSSNGQRETTSFEVSYYGARARCRSDRDVPFECAISDSTGTSQLTLGRGCTDGQLGGVIIQTDTVVMAGRRFPAREVSLVDAQGVLAYSRANADDDLELYTRTALPSQHIVAVAAVQAFLQLDDLPAACITAG